MSKSNHKMRSVIAAALTLVVGIGSTTFASAAKTFTDVSANSWYRASVEYVTSNNLFNGTSSTEFSPNASMTRGMFVTVLGRLGKVNAASYSGLKFTDVPQGHTTHRMLIGQVKVLSHPVREIICLSRMLRLLVIRWRAC